jgi:dynein heavy chain 2
VSKSGGQTKHLISGLEKLAEAQRQVDSLSTEANEKKKRLSVAQKEASVSMQKISVSMEQKAERKTEVEALQNQCNKD